MRIDPTDENVLVRKCGVLLDLGDVKECEVLMKLVERLRMSTGLFGSSSDKMLTCPGHDDLILLKERLSKLKNPEDDKKENENIA